MQSMKIPGAAATTIIAVVIAAGLKQAEVEFAGADWLPILVALVGYALKYLQVWGAPAEPETTGAHPAAAPLAGPQTRSKVVRFLFG